MTPRALPPKALIALSILALAGCGSFDDLLTGSRGRGPGAPGGPPSDPLATEAGTCQLARQAVRDAVGVIQLQGETCTASHTRPGAWQARIDVAAGAQQQSYQVELQPQRQG